MGLFDRFRSRVRDAAEQIDVEQMLASEDTEEAQQAIKKASVMHSVEESEEGWEEEVEYAPVEQPESQDDDWDDWDD